MKLILSILFLVVALFNHNVIAQQCEDYGYIQFEKQRVISKATNNPKAPLFPKQISSEIYQFLLKSNLTNEDFQYYSNQDMTPLLFKKCQWYGININLDNNVSTKETIVYPQGTCLSNRMTDNVLNKPIFVIQKSATAKLKLLISTYGTRILDEETCKKKYKDFNADAELLDGGMYNHYIYKNGRYQRKYPIDDAKWYYSDL